MSTPFTRSLRRAPVALCVSVAVLAGACQGGVGGVAATVNGHEISESALDAELNGIAANRDYVLSIEQSQTSTGQPQKVVGAGGRGTFDLQFTDLVLTRQILLSLVHAELVRRHLAVSAADLNAATQTTQSQLGQGPSGKDVFTEFPASYRNVLVRRTAEIAVLQRALGATTIDDAAIQRYYDANKVKQFTQTCASGLQVATQAQAEQIRAQLVGGADFATLARRFSTDPGSAAKGGDLGCNARGSLPGGVDQLGVGELTPVVPTQNGFAVLKVTDRKVQPLSAVRDQIVQALQNQGAGAIGAFVQKAATSAKVSVDPRYGTWQPAASTPGVVPPNAPPASAGGAPLSAVPAAPPSTPATPGAGGETSSTTTP